MYALSLLSCSRLTKGIGSVDWLIGAAGYVQALRPGVRASFGLALDTQRLNDVSSEAAAHKVGASITSEG